MQSSRFVLSIINRLYTPTINIWNVINQFFFIISFPKCFQCLFNDFLLQWLWWKIIIIRWKIELDWMNLKDHCDVWWEERSIATLDLRRWVNDARESELAGHFVDGCRTGTVSLACDKFMCITRCLIQIKSLQIRIDLMYLLCRLSAMANCRQNLLIVHTFSAFFPISEMFINYIINHWNQNWSGRYCLAIWSVDLLFICASVKIATWKLQRASLRLLRGSTPNRDQRRLTEASRGLSESFWKNIGS